MKEEFLFNTVRKKYSHPLEIEFLKKMSETGLEDYEEIIINKYCKIPASILVIGCGAGRESFSLIQKNLNVTGIDIIEELVNICESKARKNIIKANFLVMNACNLGFKSESFNYIILLGQLISLIPLRKNRIELLKECKGVLKKDGILILTTHSRERNLREKLKWNFINLIRKIIPLWKNFEEGDKWIRAISGYNLTKEKTFIHLYTPKEALEDIAQAGLKLLSCRCATEIVNYREYPEIREKDKYIIYVTIKK